MVFRWLLSNKHEDKKPISTKKVSRKDASNEWVKSGEDMANANKLDEALTCFENALKINPQNDFAWGDKGLILSKQEKTEEALASFSNAISINPNNATTWHNKGLTLIQAKRLKESI